MPGITVYGWWVGELKLAWLIVGRYRYRYRYRVGEASRIVVGLAYVPTALRTVAESRQLEPLLCAMFFVRKEWRPSQKCSVSKKCHEDRPCPCGHKGWQRESDRERERERERERDLVRVCTRGGSKGLRSLDGPSLSLSPSLSLALPLALSLLLLRALFLWKRSGPCPCGHARR